MICLSIDLISYEFRRVGQLRISTSIPCVEITSQGIRSGPRTVVTSFLIQWFRLHERHQGEDGGLGGVLLVNSRRSRCHPYKRSRSAQRVFVPSSWSTAMGQGHCTALGVWRAIQTIQRDPAFQRQGGQSPFFPRFLCINAKCLPCNDLSPQSKRSLWSTMISTVPTIRPFSRPISVAPATNDPVSSVGGRRPGILIVKAWSGRAVVAGFCLNADSPSLLAQGRNTESTGRVDRTPRPDTLETIRNPEEEVTQRGNAA